MTGGRPSFRWISVAPYWTARESRAFRSMPRPWSHRHPPRCSLGADGYNPPSPGGVPEWPKGTGCKPVGSAFGGSNPPAPNSVVAESDGEAAAVVRPPPRLVPFARDEIGRAHV